MEVFSNMKTIKKIVALATGATMLGATMMGAMAADLANYPAPFVEGCSFSGALVIGEGADPSDVAGAVDIASSLAISGETTTTGTGTEVTVEGEAVKIEATSDNLNIGDNLTEVKSAALDDDDLPTVLAEGVFTADDGDEFDYDQEITLDDGLEFTHWADSEYNDKEPTLGIRIPDGQHILIYELDFSEDAESDVDSNGDLEDLEGASIEMMGNTYDIVEADNATNIKLELMGGAVKDVMEQGEVKTITIDDKEYEVEVTYIGGTTSQVKFKINGQVTKALEEDDTYKLDDGTQIGVREILEEEAGEVTADQVEFYIGAEKLTLENGSELQINDEDLSDLTDNAHEIDVTIDASFGSTTEIEKIKLNWTSDDDLFVTEDSELMLPELESFKISYEGLTIPTEETILIDSDGDETIQLTVDLEEGTETIPILSSNSTLEGNFTLVGGDTNTEGVVTSANNTIIYNLTNNNEDMYFVATYMSGSAGETYLLTVDADSDGVNIEDAITGEDYETELENGTNFEIGSAELTMVNFKEDAWVRIVNNSAETYFDRLVTKEGALVMLPTAWTAPYPTTYLLNVTEEDDNEDIGQGAKFNVTLGFTADNETTVKDVEGDFAAESGGDDWLEIGDTEQYQAYVESALSTKIVHDKDPDQETVEITYHGSETYGNMYLAETETGFGRAESSGTAVCKVTVPKAKMDSEITDVGAQNLIVVGGPCANTVAAEVMDVASTVPECLEGFEEGKAMIKMYEQTSGKVAMVVAGYSALDTRKATDVLYDYEDYDLSGDEVEVVGTTRSDVSVSAVSE